MKNLEITLDSREVAAMVEKEHHKLLRDIRTYIDQMEEINKKAFEEGKGDASKIGLVDFFRESGYVDAKGENRPCYQITKKGCEFIAHKMTGIKGTEFTVRYINRFHEMERELISPNSSDIPIGEVASYLKALDRVAVRQNLAPYKIAVNFKKVSEQFGILLSDDFVKVPEYEQMTLDLMER